VSRRRLVVEADGGSRGNPGPAAYGTVVRDGATGAVLVELAEHIGTASNNVAEYRGVIAGLTEAHQIDPEADVDVRLDSKLIVEQLSGRWQVKHPDMRVLAKQALAIWPAGRVAYTWVPRAQNRAADRLVNEALDLAARGRPWEPGTAPELGDADELEDAPPNRLVGWAHDLGVPTTLVLLRHGETAHTREKRFSGSGGDDPPLSVDGQAQARASAERLGVVLGTGPDAVVAVVSSPLQRARQTAEVVAGLLGVPMEVDDDLAECNFGAWEGKTFAEVEEQWPAELTAWLASTAVPPPRGESFDQVLQRVRAARERLLTRAHARTVVVVSHVTPIKTLVLLALEAPARAAYRMELAPASLSTVLWFDDGNASVRSLNDTQHLDGLLPYQHV
jgi:ribonuclease H / adenosylcobalamin/alpha-ribazole phosphatase